jgi:hypothetical protein
MTSEHLRLWWRRDLSDALATALKRAGQRPADECVSFLRAVAALLEPGFIIPAVSSVVREPAETARGDHNGSYYYEGAFREGDDERFIEIETSYNRPEEMMHPETHSWFWRYTVRGLSGGRHLELRCDRDEWACDTSGASAALDVTGSAQECALVLAAFRERFADVTSA